MSIFFFIAQKIKTAQVIKYHRKKTQFVGKKDVNLIWVQRCMTTQLSVKVMQRCIAKKMAWSGRGGGNPQEGEGLNKLLLFLLKANL
ncbi:unnamed protein product [Staurois parvus]|uniref:Uncharacterized protein n=1 Tax=Staurois parvus TaxID=386267 RepID=A0ABN9GXN5_9NEOB|nr:unnamed protein product [Staurois parvus]